MAESMWGLMTIIGPIILLIALIWLVFQRRSNKTTHTTESGTRAEYDDEEQRRRDGTDGL